MQPLVAPTAEPIRELALARQTRALIEARLGDARIDAELSRDLVAYWRIVQRMQGDEPPSVATLFLLVAGSEGRELDAALVEAAAGCELFVFAISLFDAIQDHELEGPLAGLGDAMASNAALVALMQAIDGLARIGLLNADGLRARLLDCILERAMASGRGQHRDLRGRAPATLDEVVAIAVDKTAALPMTAELAALCAGCDERRQRAYAQLAQQSALVRQCCNDIRDLFGKEVSGDLLTGKWNLPTAAFWVGADAAERARFEALRAELPDSMPALRTLLFETEAVHEVAGVLERARRTIHATLAELEREHAPISWIARRADLAAARVYGGRGAR